MVEGISALITVLCAAIAAALLLGAIVGALSLGLLHRCPPDSMLVVSGRRTEQRDGAARNFRVVFAGRVLRMPFVEVVREVKRSYLFDFHIVNAYSKGGIPLQIDGVANVDVEVVEPRLSHFVERFVGQDPSAVCRASADALESMARIAVAEHLPDALAANPRLLEDALVAVGDDVFGELGLSLRDVTVLSVTDNVGYLASGRLSGGASS